MTAPQQRPPSPPRAWTVLSLIEWSRDYLAERGFDEARLHVELMLARVLRLTRLQLYLQFDRPLASDELAVYRGLFQRRLAHEPLQYILGEAAFMGITLGVGPGVLIPRPETELLVECALARIRGIPEPGVRVLDVGTGSGNIALALAQHAGNVQVTGLDVSEAAVERSRSNAARLKIGRVDFIRADVFDTASVRERFSIVVANPPYIARDEFESLMPEVRIFEPREALTDEEDGLGFLRRLAPRVKELLQPAGVFLCEIGHGQAKSAREIIAAAGFSGVTVHADYAGIPRVVEADLPS
jgi:release factor glutamine methyltransferase